MNQLISCLEDPWRLNTPHSDIAKKRPDTILRPFRLIPGGCQPCIWLRARGLIRAFRVEDAVHHYDENGLPDHTQEPPVIQTIHGQEVTFVKAWLADFKRV